MTVTLSRALPLVGLLALAACSEKAPRAESAHAARPAPAGQPAPTAPTMPLGPDPVTSSARPTPGEELMEPSRDLGGVLPLKHGIFVASDVDCGDPPNAAIRRYDGAGLSGAHTRDCRATVLSHQGRTYEVDQSCIDAGAGPAPRSSERQTIVIENNLEFTLRRAAGEQTFKYCAASLLPSGVR
jgi:hypothetical protein